MVPKKIKITTGDERPIEVEIDPTTLSDAASAINYHAAQIVLHADPNETKEALERRRQELKELGNLSRALEKVSQTR